MITSGGLRPHLVCTLFWIFLYIYQILALVNVRHMPLCIGVVVNGL